MGIRVKRQDDATSPGSGGAFLSGATPKGKAQGGSADLLLLSTYVYTAWKHLLFGSDAENIKEYVPCPVLVVH